MTSKKGFAIAYALLLLAILSILGGSLTRLFIIGQEDAGGGVKSAHALRAAKAGLELAAYQSRRLGLCEASVVSFPGLMEYPVTLSCSRSSRFDEVQGREVSMDAWTVVACNADRCPQEAPSPGYVERELRLTTSR